MNTKWTLISAWQSFYIFLTPLFSHSLRRLFYTYSSLLKFPIHLLCYSLFNSGVIVHFTHNIKEIRKGMLHISPPRVPDAITRIHLLTVWSPVHTPSVYDLSFELRVLPHLLSPTQWSDSVNYSVFWVIKLFLSALSFSSENNKKFYYFFHHHQTPVDPTSLTWSTSKFPLLKKKSRKNCPYFYSLQCPSLYLVALCNELCPYSWTNTTQWIYNWPPCSMGSSRCHSLLGRISPLEF